MFSVIGKFAEQDCTGPFHAADEYDAAQERGEVAGHGGDKVSNVAKSNVAATAADIGLRRDYALARSINRRINSGRDGSGVSFARSVSTHASKSGCKRTPIV